MYCPNCGEKLPDGSKFCMSCGARIAESSNGQETGTDPTDQNQTIKPTVVQPADQPASSEIAGMDTGSDTADASKTGPVKMKLTKEKGFKAKNNSARQPEEKRVGGIQSDESHPERNGGLFNKIWNSDGFTDAAIKFGQIFEWIAIPLFLWGAALMFQDKGFWGYLFGIIMLFAALGNLLSILRRRKKKKDFRAANRICPYCGFKSNSKAFCSSCGAVLPQLSARDLAGQDDLKPENLKKMKRNMILYPILLVCLFIFVMNGGMMMLNGTEPVQMVKDTSFDGYSHSVGYMVDQGLSGAKWDKEQLGPYSYLVYVSGYSPYFSKQMKLTFTCDIEKEGDTNYGYVSLKSVAFPESGDIYTDNYNLNLAMSSLEG